MKSGIYKITCLVNSKFYIGSADDLKRRKRTHWTALRRNYHANIILQRTFNKYSEEAFEFEIIEHCEKDQLIIREQYYIDILKPQFNIRKIAQSNFDIGKPVLQINLTTFEIIKEFDSARLACKAMNVAQNVISESIRRKQLSCGFLWLYKKDFSISKCKVIKKKLAQSWNPFKKPIIRVDKEGNFIEEFESVIDATRKFDLDRSAVNRVLKGEMKKTKGMYFKNTA